MAGDPVARELRKYLHEVADLVGDYVDGLGERDVLAPVSPGEVSGPSRRRRRPRSRSRWTGFWPTTGRSSSPG